MLAWGNLLLHLYDIPGTVLEVFLWAVLLLLPGYVVGFALNLFGFRRLSLNWRLAVSVPLSTGISPLLAYWGIRFRIADLCFGIIAAAAGILFAGFWGHESIRATMAALRRIPRAGVLFAAVWLVVTVLTLADVGVGDRLYNSVPSVDHTLRVALTDAVAREGIPPFSPLDRINGPVPLRYHFFWFALCGVAGGPKADYLSSRASLNASVVWAGFALMCMVPLWLRMFEGLDGESLRRRAAIGAALFGVTGLDVVPGLILPLVEHHPVMKDTEWWTHDQVTSWVDATLWVPHHIAAVVAGMTGFLLIWYAASQCERRGERIVHAVAAGVAFACAVGCSAFVAVALAAGLGAWFVATLILRLRRQTALFALAGAVAAILVMPYLAEMRDVMRGAGSLFTLGIWYSTFFIYQFQWLDGHLRIPDPVDPFIALPFEYAVEFGFFLFAAVVKIRQLYTGRRLRATDWAVLTFGGTAFLFSTFVRSGAITNNDPGLGWRGMLLVQFLLIFWGAEWLDSTSPLRKLNPIGRKWMWPGIGLLAVGIATTVAQVAVLRLVDPAIDAGLVKADPPESNIGRRTAALHKLYAVLDHSLEAGAVIQYDPVRNMDVPWGLYSHRQTAAAGERCTLVGGDYETCHSAVELIAAIFDGRVREPEQARAIASRYGIDVVVVADNDPVWLDKQSWIYRMRPTVDEGLARAYVFSAQQVRR